MLPVRSPADAAPKPGKKDDSASSSAGDAGLSDGAKSDASRMAKKASSPTGTARVSRRRDRAGALAALLDAETLNRGDRAPASAKDNKPDPAKSKAKASQGKFAAEMAEWDRDLNRTTVKKVKMTDASGSQFDGAERLDGVFVGSITYKDGGQYEGEASHGKRHGKGKMSYPSGGEYRGGWRDGQRSGQGVSLAVNGNRYEGKFESDAFHGKGRYLWANGDYYDGEFRNGRQDGKGVRVRDGDRYVGSYRQGLQHGHGVLTYQDGDRYEGEWEAGKRSGKGEYVWSSGAGLCR